MSEPTIDIGEQRNGRQLVTCTIKRGVTLTRIVTDAELPGTLAEFKATAAAFLGWVDRFDSNAQSFTCKHGRPFQVRCSNCAGDT